MKNAKNLKKSTYMWFLEELAYKKTTYSGVPLLCRFLGDKIFENRHKTGKFSGELG
jgi:hypothetical protein